MNQTQSRLREWCHPARRGTTQIYTRVAVAGRNGEAAGATLRKHPASLRAKPTRLTANSQGLVLGSC